MYTVFYVFPITLYTNTTTYIHTQHTNTQTHQHTITGFYDIVPEPLLSVGDQREGLLCGERGKGDR